MHFGGLAALLLCAGAAAAAVAASVSPRPSVHGPEPGHTGGFGEPTCRECHFDGPANPTDAAVALEGLPAAWVPGRSYPISVVVRAATLRRGGFQLAARHAAGGRAGLQAGTLAGADAGVAITAAQGVFYGHHVVESTAPTAPGEVRWNLVWTAPAEGEAVAFHVAANAANDDNSEFGDLVTTRADTVGPVSAPPRPAPAR